MNQPIEQLLEQHTPLVISQIKYFFPNNVPNFDELLHVGKIGLWKAICKFDKTMGNQLSTFAVVCIRNEILKQILFSQKYKCDNIEHHIKTIHKKDKINHLDELLPPTITNIEKQVLNLKFVDNYTVRQIGDIVGKSRQWVCNTIKAASIKIKKTLCEN